MKKRTKALLDTVATSDTTGAAVNFSVSEPNISFIASVALTDEEGSIGTNQVYIDASHDGVVWYEGIVEITLNETTQVETDAIAGAWNYYRGRTGTLVANNAVTLTLAG